jgi:hypothetical protein
MASEEFIKQIKRPKQIVDDQEEDGMIIIPAHHEGIDA